MLDLLFCLRIFFMNNCCIIIFHFITRLYNIACVHIKEQIILSVLKERVQFNTFYILLLITCKTGVPKLFQSVEHEKCPSAPQCIKYQFVLQFADYLSRSRGPQVVQGADFGNHCTIPYFIGFYKIKLSYTPVLRTFLTTENKP